MPRLDLRRLKVRPLSERQSLTRFDDVNVSPETDPAPCDAAVGALVAECAKRIREAQSRSASILLIYGAHLIRNGGSRLLGRLIQNGWATHLATNGAGAIHDWEFAHQGCSCERVGSNVSDGTFGAWDETGKYLHLAVYAGALIGAGLGESVGRLIEQGCVDLPNRDTLTRELINQPAGPDSAAQAELLHALQVHDIAPGRHSIEHPWSCDSVLGQAYRNSVPATVHPGIGYDIISVHPMFDGGAIGRAAGRDFARIVDAVAGLDHGVVLSIGSAIMGPQVFEKSLSCVNNLRRQAGRAPVSGHHIFVVDIQPGTWDWSQGEPPLDHPAYYLRFCKSYSRMGGTMHYVCCDNVQFVHHLHRQLQTWTALE